MGINYSLSNLYYTCILYTLQYYYCPDKTCKVIYPLATYSQLRAKNGYIYTRNECQ